MGSILLRSEFRRRGRSWLSLALIAGLAGAFVLIVASGARRTASAYTRFKIATLSPDLLFSPPHGSDPALADALRRTKGVRAVAGFAYFPVVPDKPGIEPFQNAGAFGPFGRQFGVDVYRYRVLAGRRADEGRVDEVTINPELARIGHLHVGERITLKGPIDLGAPKATVVGIHRGEFDIGPAANDASMLLTDAFVQRYGSMFASAPEFRPAYLVRVDQSDPRAVARAKAKIIELYGDVVGTPGPNPVSDGIRVQALALAILALVAAAATIVVVAQAVARLVASGSNERSVWTALGMSRSSRVLAAAAPAVVAGLAATALAVALAAALSGVLPTGLAGIVEPSPGVRFDLLILGAGGLGLIIVAATAAAVAARHRALRSSRPVASLGWLRRLAATGPAAVGMRSAFVGLPQRSRAQARAAISAIALGVVGLATVAVFGASEAHLFHTPEVHGFTWDLSLRPQPERLVGLRDLASSSAAVRGLAQVDFSFLAVEGRPLEAFVVEPIRGAVHPTIISGRAPVASDEIVLPPASALSGLSVGRSVIVAGPAGRFPMHVVGRAVYPGIGPQGDFNGAASVSPAGKARLGLEVQPQDKMLLIRLAPGARDDALVKAAGPDTEIVRTFLPPTLTNLRRVGDTPGVLALFLGVLAAAGIVHALAVALRSGRRELSILKTLGFTRAQVRDVLLWQAGVAALAGLVVGVPIGTALGRFAWTSVATQLGVAPRSIVSPAQLLLLAGGAIALAFVAAAGFGTQAGRVSIVGAMRAE